MRLMLAGLLLLQAGESWRVEGRSLYVWSEAEAGDALLKFCAERKVARIYLLFSGKDTPALRGFLHSAHAARVQVHAMHPGDMAEWLDAFPAKFDPVPILAWVDRLLRFNEASPAKFDGLHLDIEPHGTEHWKAHPLKLAEGYLELLRLVRAKGTFVLGAAVPHNWDREELRIGKKLLIEHVQDILDYVSVMAYRGRNVAKVLEAIEHECRYRPGRVELIQETDLKVVEEGVPLHVGTNDRLEEIFQAASARYPGLMLAIHHYGTWKSLPR
jgi:hypothetical protein